MCDDGSSAVAALPAEFAVLSCLRHMRELHFQTSLDKPQRIVGKSTKGSALAIAALLWARILLERETSPDKLREVKVETES